MFCNNCGAKVDDAASFCKECGAPVRSNEASESKPKASKGKKWLLLILVVCVVLAVSAGICIFILPASLISRQLDLGQKYLIEQDYEQAIVEFDKAIAIDPKNVDAYIGKAEAYIGMDDYEQAIKAYMMAIKIAPENPDIYLDLAEIYLNTGDRDAALEVLREGYEQTQSKRIKNQIEYLEEQMEEEAQRMAEEEERRQEEEARKQAEEEAARLAAYEPGYEPGQMMPEFSMTDANENVIKLSEYKGKALYLNFFTTWCPYCYYELPDMQAIKDTYGDDVEVVLVDLAESPALAEQYASDYGVTLPIYHLPAWQVGYYTITGVPESIVLNSDGVIVDKHYGMADYEWMEQAVSAAVRD